MNPGGDQGRSLPLLRAKETLNQTPRRRKACAGVPRSKRGARQTKRQVQGLRRGSEPQAFAPQSHAPLPRLNWNVFSITLLESYSSIRATP